MKNKAFPALLLSFCILLPALAQTTPQKPSNDQDEVVKITTNLVQVDAVVTKDGKMVTNLTANDFEIYEDGKQQAITSFAFISNVPNKSPAQPIARDQLAAAARRVESLETQLKGLRQSDSRANDLGKQTEKLQAELAEVRRISATSIANYEENKQLKASNESLQKQVTQLSERVRELDRNVMLRWLLAGGALVLVGLVIGALIKSRPKRSTWA